MIAIAHAAANAELAERIQNNLKQADFAPPPPTLLIVILSPQANDDDGVQQALDEARRKHHHIIPVLASCTALPLSIAHLRAVDFSSGDDFVALRARIDAIIESEAVVRASNRRMAVVLGVVALLMFVTALIAIGVFGLQAPRDEFDAVDTQAAQTVQALLDRNIPRTTQEAVNFPATLEAAPTAQRPLLIQTATAIAGR